MKKKLKIFLIIVGIIILCFVLDLIFIFKLNRPLFAIRQDNGDSVNIIYKGLLYDTYNCQENSSMLIVFKWKKYSCDNTIKIKKFNNYEFSVTVTTPSKYKKKFAFSYNNVDYYYGNTDFRLYLNEGNLRYDLETSISNELVNLDDILSKSKSSNAFFDGGSKIYHYDQFNILVCHTLDGNNDVVIGDTEMQIEDYCD